MLADSSVWLALALFEHPQHAAVRQWFDAIQAPGSVLFCRSTQQSFLRLVTTAVMFIPIGGPPLTNAEAWTAYQALLSDDRVGFREGEPVALDHWWQTFSSSQYSSPKVWMDAYLAAFAVAGDLRFVTLDGGFRQFPGLDVLVLP